MILAGPEKSMLGNGIYAVAGSRDALASTAGTTARFGKLGAAAKDEAAILAAGRFQNESTLSITRDGLHDVSEMFLHLPFRNAEELRELIGGQTGAA
jgi:hypothetical protein